MTHLTIEPSILYVGTPVALLSTVNEDGTVNLAPMSSAWALGDVVVLGVGVSGQTAVNLRERPEVVINYPSPELWESVERLAPLTAAHQVPSHKQDRFRHERAKFTASGLTPVTSELVTPPRVAERPLQFAAERIGSSTGRMRLLPPQPRSAAVPIAPIRRTHPVELPIRRGGGGRVLLR